VCNSVHRGTKGRVENKQGYTLEKNRLWKTRDNLAVGQIAHLTGGGNSRGVFQPGEMEEER